MHKRLLLSTAIAMGMLISASAQADARYDNSMPWFEAGPSASRQDVRKDIDAQLGQAHAGGVPVASNLKALQSAQTASKKTREQVRQELEAAVEQGVLNQHDSVYPRS